MTTKIRLLGIAPYENMQSLMLKVAEEYPQIELTVFVGDMQQGVEKALRNFHNDYDAIISRGGTATLIRERLDLPVVEIPITDLDVMRAMNLASHVSDHYAIVGFPNITANARNLCQLMQITMDSYTVHDAREAEQALWQLRQQGTQTILCDMIAYTTARKMGMDVLLITSDADSIRNAYDEAIRLYRNYRRLQEENRFLRSLVWNQVNHTVVFNGDGELFFSTKEGNDTAIVEYLRQECLTETEPRHILKQIKNVVYSIRTGREQFGNMEYTTYYFTESRAGSPDVQRGIRYVTSREAEAQYAESFYGVTNLLRDLQPQIFRINRSSLPVMVCGEDGTCKEQVVNYLYQSGQRRNRPLVIVDCYALNDKSWSYLIDHHNSPFAQNDCTIFLKNVDVLSGQRLRQLLTAMLDMDICKRNRMIFSCVCKREQEITETGLELMNALECLSLYLPPARKRVMQLPAVFNLYLSHLNANMEKQIIGFEDDAMRRLQEYDWPNNYSQLQRVLKELALMAQGNSITAQEVRDILKREQTLTTAHEQVEDKGSPLDLRMTLDELDKEIVRRVLAEENGNQTRTARRLGIGRTTLWRLMNNP